MFWKPSAIKKAVEKLKTANELLGMLRANRIPHVQHFVFNSRLEVRNVNDDAPFKKLGNPKKLEQQLLDASDPRILMTTGLEEGSVCFRVYTFGDVLAFNDKIYGECVEKVVYQTYAAVGLDTPKEVTSTEVVDQLRGTN